MWGLGGFFVSLSLSLFPLSLLSSLRVRVCGAWCGAAGGIAFGGSAGLPIRNIFVGSFEPDVPSGFASCFTYGPPSWVLLALCGLGYF